MMPRMDPRTQLKYDRGEWGYRYRLVRRGGGPGRFPADTVSLSFVW